MTDTDTNALKPDLQTYFTRRCHLPIEGVCCCHRGYRCMKGPKNG